MHVLGAPVRITGKGRLEETLDVSSPTFSNKQDQFQSFIRLFRAFYKLILSKLMIPLRNVAIPRLGTSTL